MIRYSWSELPETFKMPVSVREKKVNWNSKEEVWRLLKGFVKKEDWYPLSGVQYEKDSEGNDWIVATNALILFAIPEGKKQEKGIFVNTEPYNEGGQYPEWRKVIPKPKEIKNVHTVDLHTIMKYAQIGRLFANKDHYPAKFRYGKQQSIVINLLFLEKIAKLLLSLGIEKTDFHFHSNKTAVTITKAGKSILDGITVLIMPMQPDGQEKKILGVQNDDFEYFLTSYYDFSKDAIVNEKGEEEIVFVEKKKSEYQQGGIKSAELRKIKNLVKRPVLEIMEYVAVQNGEWFRTNFEQDYFGDVDLSDGVYLPTNFGWLFDDGQKLENYPRTLTNSKHRINQLKIPKKDKERAASIFDALGELMRL